MVKTKRRSGPVKKRIVKKTTEKKPMASITKLSQQVIKSKEVYDLTMTEIDGLMKKGEKHLTQPELTRLRNLSEAAEIYESKNIELPTPTSLKEIIRMKMYTLQLTQGYTAKLLGVSDAKFSMIMNGRQKPDIYFIKALHEKLNVDGNEILDAL